MQVAEFLASMDNLKLNIKGPRVAVVDVDEHNATGILFPDNASRSYVFGKVFALGDNIAAGGRREPYYFSIGDVVVFQANPMMMANCRFEVDGNRFLLILQGDAIAKMTNGMAELTVDTFQPAGEWVLCSIKTHMEVGGIIIPDSAAKSSPKPPTFHLVKSGPYAGVDITSKDAGTELLVERNRATVIQIGKERYVYVHKDYVYGSVDA